MSVVNAFDLARIQSEVKSGKPKTLQGYLDELLPEAERLQRAEDAFFDMLDHQTGFHTVQ